MSTPKKAGNKSKKPAAKPKKAAKKSAPKAQAPQGNQSN